MQNLPTPYQEFIFKSRYARWVDSENRRENWPETVKRYFDFMVRHLSKNMNYEVDKNVRNELEQAVLNLEILPSMRALMTAGPALERDAICGYNCFSGYQKFLTKEYGLVRFKHVPSTSVTVLNKNKEWVPAEIKSFGNQKLIPLAFGHDNTKRTVWATEGHDWLLENGEKVKSKYLRVGDKIPYITAPKIVSNNIDYVRGVQHGLVYGDGTVTKSAERVKGYHIRLCGDQNDLLPYFEGYPVTYPPSTNGEPVIMMYDGFAKTHSLKTLPDISETSDYLIGFFRGWMAADGAVAANHQVSLCCSEEEAEWCKTVMSIHGYTFSVWSRLPDTTNFGERKKISGRLYVDRASLDSEDFIIQRKRDNFKPAKITWSYRGEDEEVKKVRVEAGLDAYMYDEVYCAVVPNTHTFTLESGIVTGNCAYLTVDDLRAFDECLVILMSGTGVGFSVEQKYVDKLPTVAEHFERSDTTIVVDDSKAGWGRALRELITLLYSGQIPKWDVSKLRPAGAKLKIMGGRSSGPEPLVDLFNFCVHTIKSAKGRRLTTLECHDLVCKIAEVVVVGGTRRSALISLSDLSDVRIQTAKSGQWWLTHPHRALANNSAVYHDDVTLDQFMDEWKALYQSGSGERGIINRDAMQRIMARNGRRDSNHLVGTNPCVPGDTLILTDQGYKEIKDCVDKETVIWNGKEWSKVKPFSTGFNPLVRVHFSDGTYLDCTPYHKFVLAGNVRVMACELAPGERLEKFKMPVVETGIEYSVDAYSQGFYSGDGTKNIKHSNLYNTKYMCQNRLVGTFSEEHYDKRKTWKHGAMFTKDFVPVDGTKEYCLNWLAGILDSDGTVTRDINGNGVQIGSIDKNFLLNIRLMLTRLGVQAKISTGNVAGMRPLPDGRGGTAMYQCQTGYRLLIGNTDTYHLLYIGLKCNRLELHNNAPQRDARRFVQVTGVTDLTNYDEYDYGYTETFCFTDELNSTGTFNGIVTGNCSEIILRPQQFCNLTSVICRSSDTPDILVRKVTLATILGTWQSTLTHFKYLRKKWKDNCDEERLLGVSLNGIADSFLGTNAPYYTKPVLNQLKEAAINANKVWADNLGINVSTAITCIKPEGTTSQLVNCSSGIHSRHAPYYIRRVRQDNKDPLTQFMKDQGVPWEPCVLNPNQISIFSFPIAGPENTAQSAIHQLEQWKAFQESYTEHKPSITVTIKNNEWLDVAAWVWKNMSIMSGVSFLPDATEGNVTYQQMPYETITKEEYEKLEAVMPKTLDWDKLSQYELEDTTTASKEFACVGDVCEVVGSA